jgi:hypothetical protein
VVATWDDAREVIAEVDRSSAVETQLELEPVLLDLPAVDVRVADVSTLKTSRLFDEIEKKQEYFHKCNSL